MGNSLANTSHQIYDLGGGNYGGVDPAALIAAAISQDQINLTWSAVAGQGIVIERSTAFGGPFTAVYYADDLTLSVSLYSHQPAIEYFFRCRRMFPNGTFSAYSSVVSDTTIAAGNIYYVATTGSDSADGSIGTPWLTIQRGVWDLVAGDVLNINAGTYTEAAEWSPAAGGGNPDKFGNALGVVLHESGTPTAPIIIQPTPGTGAVILDQLNAATGFHFHDVTRPWPDYIHIKGMEHTKCFPLGLWSVDGGGDYADADSLLSRGVVLEGNHFHSNTFTTNGANASAIRMDTHKEWVVRNNIVEAIKSTVPDSYDMNGSGSIYSYSVHSSLIEFNDIRDGYTGVYLKDIVRDIPVDTLVATIRFNKFTNINRVVYINAGGVGEGKPVRLTITNNIFRDVWSYISTIGGAQEVRPDIRNNFIDYGALAASTTEPVPGGAQISSSPDAALSKILNITGNIFGDALAGWNYYLTEDFSHADHTDLAECEDNIYVSGPDVQLGQDAKITSIVTWRSTTNARMSIANPDTNGLANQSLATLATNAAAGDYTIPGGSPALALLLDGSNAGPYQFGNTTVIGVIT